MQPRTINVAMSILTDTLEVNRNSCSSQHTISATCGIVIWEFAKIHYDDVYSHSADIVVNTHIHRCYYEHLFTDIVISVIFQVW